MALSISDLFKALTVAEVEETLLASIETLGLPARQWRSGGALRVILRVVATLYAGLTSLLVQIAKAGFLDDAEGGWLTLLARHVYGVERGAATFAGGSITVTNAGGGIYGPFAIGELVFTSPTSGKTYANTAIVSIAASSTQAVDVTAVEAGAGSSAGVGEVSQLVSPLTGVTVANATAIVGTDEQSDASLKAAALAHLGTFSTRGPRSAYLDAVQSAKRVDGSLVDINRVAVSTNASTGLVTVYAASPSGTPIAGDLTLADASIEANARPDLGKYVLLGATAVPVTRSVSVWAKRADGVTAAALEELVEDALATMAAEYPIGGITKPPDTVGKLYQTTIEGTAKAAHSSFYAADAPGGDVVIGAGEVPTIAATVIVHVVEVP